MLKQARQMDGPYWYKQIKKPKQSELYAKHKQPTLESWIRKLAIMHHLNQTTHDWQIHTKNQQMVKQNEHEWQEKWLLRKKLHENFNKRTQEQTEYLKQHIYEKTSK